MDKNPRVFELNIRREANRTLAAHIFCLGPEEYRRKQDSELRVSAYIFCINKILDKCSGLCRLCMSEGWKPPSVPCGRRHIASDDPKDRCGQRQDGDRDSDKASTYVGCEAYISVSETTRQAKGQHQEENSLESFQKFEEAHSELVKID